MPTFLEYINSNKSDVYLDLGNWIYRPSDKFELVIKFNSIPGNWADIISAAYNSNTSKLWLQNNYWSNRSVINVAHNGTYSGDGNYSFAPTRDFTKYARIVLDGNIVQMYSGDDVRNINTQLVDRTLGTNDDTDTEIVRLFNRRGSSFPDFNFYYLKVWRNGELVHYYKPIADGVYDTVTNLAFYITGTGYINGPEAITTYTIIFKPNGGEGEMPNQIAEIDESVFLDRNTFHRHDYVFLGWSLTPRGEVIYMDQALVTNLAEAGYSVTLYAVWEYVRLNLEFSYNKSDERQIYKTLIEGVKLAGTLREGTSIINPIIMVESAKVIRYNFCYIPQFRRYYYVRDIESYRKNLWILTLECDVLMSFKNDIARCEVVVDKQTMGENGDEYIDDNSLVSDNYMYNTVYNFNGQGFNENPTYILITAG